MFYLYLQRIGPYKDRLVVKDKFMNIVFECDKVSSYPDYPQGIGIFNDGMPDATVENGEYLLLEKIQDNLFGNDWRVLELVNKDYSQNVPCWRKVDGKAVKSTTAGSNIHFFLEEGLHLTYANSTACIIMPKEDFLKLREVVGMTKEAYKKGRLIGMLFIYGSPRMPDPYEGVKW